jgi:hypothetical protein
MRAIVLTGVVMGVVGAGAVAALLHFYGGGTDRDRAGLDVVRTAGALVAGTGGAIALLLAARRQRSTELTLEHQRLILEHQREVAVEQRITELYTAPLTSSATTRRRCGWEACTRWNGWRRTIRLNGRPLWM